MALKHFNPTSPARRGLVLVDKRELHKGKPEKSLVEGLTKTGGRGGGGRIAVRFRGGGAKRLYRVVDFKRRKFDIVGVIQRLEYDPNRTAFIALVKYADGELAYILAPQRLKVGDDIRSPLAQAVGSKGYHAQAFADGPYPVSDGRFKA